MNTHTFVKNVLYTPIGGLLIIDQIKKKIELLKKFKIHKGENLKIPLKSKHYERSTSLFLVKNALQKLKK